MISAIIPHWPISKYHNDLLKQCVKSLRADEVIVVLNDAIGFAKAVNQGLRVATGDYLCVINNDTYIIDGQLKDIVDPKGVSCPLVNGYHSAFGCFFCIPRWVYEEVGELDERFVNSFEDNDYVRRLTIAGIPIIKKDVKVWHAEGATTQKVPDLAKESDKNFEKFQDKWKDFRD